MCYMYFFRVFFTTQQEPYKKRFKRNGFFIPPKDQSIHQKHLF